MTETTCTHCGVRFDVKPYRLARNKSGRIFCSRACRQADGTTVGAPRAPHNCECPTCGVSFKRKRVELREVNYCSYSCAAVGTGNLKAPPRGARRSVATEFKPGTKPHNTLQVGAVTVRQRPSRGDVRAWVKVAEPNVWRPRAVVVWEETHGPRPRGKVIHHVNHDPLDDRIENLQLLTRSEHAQVHSDELAASRGARRRGR